MNFWLRAAPITETAISHTSRFSLVRQQRQQPPREADFTLEAPPFERHRFFGRVTGRADRGAASDSARASGRHAERRGAW